MSDHSRARRRSALPPKQGWTAQPKLCFDLETTGIDVTQARIVSAATVHLQDQQRCESRTWLANPGIEIPSEATAIHGITTSYAREHGRDAKTVATEIKEELENAWESGAVVYGMNLSYDFTLLNCELERYGLEELKIGPTVDARWLDVYVDKYRPGKRQLTDLADLYEVPLPTAHDAAVDGEAAGRVCLAIARQHPEVARLGPRGITRLMQQTAVDWQIGFRDYSSRQGKDADVQIGWPVVGATGR